MSSSGVRRSEEHTSELQSHVNLVCRLLLETKKEQLNVRAVETRKADVGEETDASLHEARGLAGDCLVFYVGACPHRHDRLYLFFFNDTATTEIYTLSLHDALPI